MVEVAEVARRIEHKFPANLVETAIWKVVEGSAAQGHLLVDLEQFTLSRILPLALLPRKILSPLPDTHGPLIRLGRTFCFAQRLHDVGVTVVEKAAGFGVQRPDRRHIFRTKREIEDVEVFNDSFLTD